MVTALLSRRNGDDREHHHLDDMKRMEQVLVQAQSLQCGIQQDHLATIPATAGQNGHEPQISSAAVQRNLFYWTIRHMKTPGYARLLRVGAPNS